MKDVVLTPRGPKPIGPYSQAIKANGFIFISGQICIDPATGQLIAGDVAAQTERVLKNLSAVLAAAGSGLHHVVRTTVFLKNMGDFAAMNEAYARFFYDYDEAPLLIVNAASIDPIHRESDYQELLQTIVRVKRGRHFFNPAGSSFG